MIWRQEKTKDENGVELLKYYTEDFIGKITLLSENELSPKTLDACYLNLMNISSTEGQIKANEGVIQYQLERKADWIDEDDKSDTIKVL